MFVIYLSIEGFLKLGLTDRNTIMSLRIECSTFGSCTPQKTVGTNKFVIRKILIENLIDDGFSEREMSNILCVLERTVLRLKVECVLKIRNLSNISDDLLDCDALTLTNDYQNYLERTFEREGNNHSALLIQRYHASRQIGIQSRRKGRLKRRLYNVKGANHLQHIDTNHKMYNELAIGIH